MCFRPAEVASSVTCLECGKKINPVNGNFPVSCPFCESPLGGIGVGNTPGAPDPAPGPPVAAPAVSVPRDSDVTGAL